MKEFIILIGNYGSGKTELAMNFAMDAVKQGKTLLIDLDMINTYFRLNDRRKMFEELGVRVIAPNYANSGVEMLTVPAEIATAFAMDWDTVIIDLGGDSGAAALGQYHTKLAQAERERQEASVAAERKSQVGSGMRNERIRTYNFPQGRVTDHRIGLTLYRLEQVLNGDLDELIDALSAAAEAEKLQAQ